MMAFQTAKRDLRKHMRDALKNMSIAVISQQSGVATNRFLSLPEYQNANSIAVYLSMPTGELSTRSIVEDAFKRGKDVYIPYIHTVEKMSVMDMLALESMNEFESLQPDKWGIPSLQPTQVSGRRNGLKENGLDLIVMPGMAFDQEFRRLGHVALSLHEQMVEEVPVMAHDWRIDALVIGDGQYLDRRV
ncbi:5-formyltetrahydrofolate cyclo-ligase [Penicillium angulare]|uniref:5-formyltetrahydrofolate cyclo-ligase n=1 Tax=Penicillium angulare TaxID=116970 RepID=UPI002540ACCD|nr:5-formyltetrahydrofolate cyclo-ligase [Penicillium angulare]KAJ5263865.1 5-formyltetrahydrofolate cyclo-ligase [Penicillium angulare]